MDIEVQIGFVLTQKINNHLKQLVFIQSHGTQRECITNVWILLTTIKIIFGLSSYDCHEKNGT